jgi:D-glycero-alpha-D-manno-heptose-7-phosphate kinase
MIIARTPFRISFTGGGSDIPVFYRKEAGKVVSTSIDKYIYIAVHPYFYPNKTFIKYSKTELVDDIRDVEHPIIREVLKQFNVSGIDLNSISDIPAGTGLGSSCTFTVAMLHAISAYAGSYSSKEFIADQACDIEINRLGEPIGKQDQYAASYGGLNFITFHPTEAVTVEKIGMKPESIKQLEKNLLLFYTHDTRSASSILAEQGKNVGSKKDKHANLAKMVGLSEDLRSELEHSNIDALGEILHTSWMYKKELATAISNSKIDHYYGIGKENGALGGKLLGAGGGGFLLFYAKQENQERLRRSLSDLTEISFSFDYAGSTIIYNN